MPKKNSGRLILAIGILLVLTAFFLWYRYSRRPIEVPATRTTATIPTYQVQTQAGRWVDTGVWIGEYQAVQAEGTDIFTLAVDNTSRQAWLDGSKFVSNLNTFPCASAQPDDAWITSQGKIYVYADKSISITFFIVGDNRFSSKHNPCAETAEEKQAKQQAGGWVVVKAFLGVLIFMLVIGLILSVFKKERKAKKNKGP